MSAGIWFWILFVVGFLWSGWAYNSGPAESRLIGFWPVLLWVLLGLLGWAVFGSPLKG